MSLVVEIVLSSFQPALAEVNEVLAYIVFICECENFVSDGLDDSIYVVGGGGEIFFDRGQAFRPFRIKDRIFVSLYCLSVSLFRLILLAIP